MLLSVNNAKINAKPFYSQYLSMLLINFSISFFNFSIKSSFFNNSISDKIQVSTINILYFLYSLIQSFLFLIRSLSFYGIALVCVFVLNYKQIKSLQRFQDNSYSLFDAKEQYQISKKEILKGNMYPEGQQYKIQSNQMPIVYNSEGQQPTHVRQNYAKHGDQSIIYGTKKMTSFLKFFIPFMLAAPYIAYYMAVKKGEQHKFPHPTITDTACHYPQNIQFRLIMAGSGPFISLIYWVLFRWVKYQKQRTEYQGPIFGYLHYIGQVSVWGFMIAMGTIDGLWYPDLHTNSAIFFFITLFVIVMSQTIVIRQIYQWDSSIISKKSYFIKMIFGIYVAIVWIYCIYGLLTESSNKNDDQDPFIVILEWNSVYVCIFWMLSFLPQWKDIRVTLTEKVNSG